VDLGLDGKAAIVTGGSRGIGMAVARGLATEGAGVAIVARSREPLEAAARELTQETGGRVIAIPADTGDDDSVREMVAAAVAAFGHVDILVNCAARPAGDWLSARLPDISDELFLETLNVKLMGYLRCARETAPHMREQGWGRIINVSGMAARQASSVIGSVRNVAVVAMTGNLAAELGPHGINVTVVHPGLTRTERLPGLIDEQARREGIEPAAVEERMAQANTLRRIVDAREVADVILFLASPRSVAINGDVIAAGGGAGSAIYY